MPCCLQDSCHVSPLYLVAGILADTVSHMCPHRNISVSCYRGRKNTLNADLYWTEVMSFDFIFGLVHWCSFSRLQFRIINLITVLSDKIRQSDPEGGGPGAQTLQLGSCLCLGSLRFCSDWAWWWWNGLLWVAVLILPSQSIDFL